MRILVEGDGVAGLAFARAAGDVFDITVVTGGGREIDHCIVLDPKRLARAGAILPPPCPRWLEWNAIDIRRGDTSTRVDQIGRAHV